MAHALKVYADHGVVCLRFTGETTVGDVRDLFLQWIDSPEFNATFVLLADCRGITEIEATFLSILTAAQALQPELSRFDQGGLAVALVSRQTVFGMVRILEQVLDYTSRLRLVTAWETGEAMQAAGRGDQDFDALFDF